MLCGGKGRICVSGPLFQEAGICTSLLMQILYSTYLQQSCKNQSRDCFQLKAAALGTLITEQDANEAQLKPHQPWDTDRGSAEEAVIQGHQCSTGSIQRQQRSCSVMGLRLWKGPQNSSSSNPCQGWGHLPLSQVTPRPVHSALGHCQDGNSWPLWVFYPQRGRGVQFCTATCLL